MSYCNFAAVKEALLSGASIPRTPIGGVIPARIKGGEPATRHKQEGAATTLLILVVVGSHVNHKTNKTRLSNGTIAREALTSISSVKRATEVLVSSKHLLKEPSRVRGVNTYWFGPAVAAAVQRADTAEDDPSSGVPGNSGGDVVDDNLADELEGTNPSMPPSTFAPTSTPPKVTIPAASDTANRLAAEFGEFLAQPTKHSAVRTKHWPSKFEAMLATRSQADLLTVMKWAFSVDPNKFWPPKIRECSGDPATYLADHLDSITTAMAHPTTQSMGRSSKHTGVAKPYCTDSYLNTI